jgi:hypothetical protein
MEEQVADEKRQWTRVHQAKPFLLTGCKALILVPIFPMLGYYLLDQSGLSHWMVVHGLIPDRILGEGFGHVGLCFSIHYVFKGLRQLFRAGKIFWG